MAYTQKMQKSIAKYPLTRRGYELIAFCIRTSPIASEAKRILVLYFSQELGKLPGFDTGRFLKACGVV